MGMCIGAEPGSERQQGSVTQRCSARRGGPPGSFSRFGMHFKGAPSGVMGNGNCRGKGGNRRGYFGSWVILGEVEGF